LNKDEANDIVGSCVAYCVRHFVRLQRASLAYEVATQNSFRPYYFLQL